MALDTNDIEKIVNFVNSQHQRTLKAKEKLNIFEGELLPAVEAALANELGPAAYERARKRIAPINFLPKVINKLSTLYNTTITRELSDKSDNPVNNELLDFYTKELQVDHSGMSSNQQLNLNKYTAWEIYINKDNTPRLRVLPAHQFSVYSDDIEDPTMPTVFIKILGSFTKHTGEISKVDDSPIYKTVAVYKLFTDEEIIVVDSDGELRSEFMKENPEGINPYGVIPFIYIRNAQYSLLPLEDTSDIPMITLIPLLLTDLNYATQFMSHSIIYAIDADITNPSGNPDSIWMIKSDVDPTGESNSKAQIGAIKPEVDIDKVITLIQTELALWLDSKGLKAQGVGKLESGNLASGISKMIDEADTTQVIKSQMTIYSNAERELYYKLSLIHNVWVEQGLLVGTDINKRIAIPMDVTTIFEEPQVMVNEKERIETIKAKEESGYTTHKRAVQEANSKLTDAEVDVLIEEINEEIENERTFTIIDSGEIDGRDDNREEVQNEEERKEGREEDRREA